MSRRGTLKLTITAILCTFCFLYCFCLKKFVSVFPGAQSSVSIRYACGLKIFMFPTTAFFHAFSLNSTLLILRLESLYLFFFFFLITHLLIVPWSTFLFSATSSLRSTSSVRSLRVDVPVVGQSCEAV